MLLSAGIFTGCSTSTSQVAGNNRFASPTELTATLTNGNDVVLHWKNNATADGGNWIEYTTPGYDFIKLDAYPSDAGMASFLHANLAPGTTFIYQIQPFFGCPTKPVEITTGIAASNDLPIFAEAPMASTNEILSGAKTPRCSIRSPRTFARVVPTDLTATLSSGTSVDLHWQDHASGEDGYLLEISAHADGDFVPCALLPPAATSFRKTGLPPETKCYFRVRAFFYGQPSSTASATPPAR